MLDIQFIRDNHEIVAQKSKLKGYGVDITRLLELDTKKRELVQAIDVIRQQRNSLAEKLKKGKPSPEQLDEGRQLKNQVTDLEKQLTPVDEEFTMLLKAVPNMPLEDVPAGASEEENKVSKTWGEKPAFDFKPKTHGELAEAKGWIDKERAAKVAGARFAYLSGSLVELQFAIINFVFKTLGDEQLIERLIQQEKLDLVAKGFVPMLPPLMLKTNVYEAMDRLEPRDDRYRVGEDKDDLWLEGSAEHTLGPIFMDEILPQQSLPIRYVGYAASFRREAGSYGKDTEGIIRMHQFDKLEMEVFSTPESGLDEHFLLIALQEFMMQQLELPYQVILKCTGDIGKPNARGIDLNVWMPGQNRYLETHTADYMTDYQTRRLKTRLRQSDGQVRLAHTNDATAFALGRIMAAIIENNQTHDGHVTIPTVLQSFMSNKQQI